MRRWLLVAAMVWSMFWSGHARQPLQRLRHHHHQQQQQQQQQSLDAASPPPAAAATAAAAGEVAAAAPAAVSLVSVDESSVMKCGQAVFSSVCINLPYPADASAASNPVADNQINLVLQNFLGSRKCKSWYNDLMCRYTYPMCSQSNNIPCRSECEKYTASCPFPMVSCLSFPADSSATCYTYGGHKMPYNPSDILLPFSPVVFAGLVLFGGVFYWYSISRQKAAYDAITERRARDFATFSADSSIPPPPPADGLPPPPPDM